jgi:hypothetical protein
MVILRPTLLRLATSVTTATVGLMYTRWAGLGSGRKSLNSGRSPSWRGLAGARASKRGGGGGRVVASAGATACGGGAPAVAGPLVPASRARRRPRKTRRPPHLREKRPRRLPLRCPPAFSPAAKTRTAPRAGRCAPARARDGARVGGGGSAAAQRCGCGRRRRQQRRRTPPRRAVPVRIQGTNGRLPACCSTPWRALTAASALPASPAARAPPGRWRTPRGTAHGSSAEAALQPQETSQGRPGASRDPGPPTLTRRAAEGAHALHRARTPPLLLLEGCSSTTGRRVSSSNSSKSMKEQGTASIRKGRAEWAGNKDGAESTGGERRAASGAGAAPAAQPVVPPRPARVVLGNRSDTIQHSDMSHANRATI